MYCFDSRIRYSETDNDGRLTMSSLINYFQDCSTFQSEDLGVGIRHLRQEKLVWVLCSWQIIVDRYPVLGDRVQIGTLPYEMKGFMGYRNFFMTDEKGNYLARAASLWSLLSTQTGRPVGVPDYMHEKYKLEPRIEMEYASRKIVVPPGGIPCEPIVVKKHHLDSNHHVNNGQYVKMAIECLPENTVVTGLRVEYKKQAYLNDILIPELICENDNYYVTLKGEDGALYVAAEIRGMKQV